MLFKEDRAVKPRVCTPLRVLKGDLANAFVDQGYGFFRQVLFIVFLVSLTIFCSLFSKDYFGIGFSNLSGLERTTSEIYRR